jgi:opacity protein-like surface antigen
MLSGTRMILGLAAIGVTLGPALALADPETDVGFRGWGPRIGLSVDPDQVHFGAHIDYGLLSRHVRFQPNVELGFGDHVDLFTLNAEAAYRFSEQWDVWSPYLGGGIGANIRRYDTDFYNNGNNGNRNNSDTELGVNVLGGLEKGLSNGDRFFVEVKFSLNDVPDVKATVGWTFYH